MPARALFNKISKEEKTMNMKQKIAISYEISRRRAINAAILLEYCEGMNIEIKPCKRPANTIKRVAAYFSKGRDPQWDPDDFGDSIRVFGLYHNPHDLQQLLYLGI